MRERGFQYTAHALTVIRERGLERAWIERTVRTAFRRERDPRDSELIRCFAEIPERGGKLLRVVYREVEDAFVIVTAFLDRGASK